MNASEFNTELLKLIRRAMQEGIAQRKMTPLELIGGLEGQKADVIRNFQDAARTAQAPQIIPFRGPIPPTGK